MKKLLFVLTGLSIVLNMYLLLVSIPKLKSKIMFLSSKLDRYIDVNNRSDEAYSHPFPLYANEYCVYEPNTDCPRLIIHSTQWTDNEWKNIDVTFVDRDNVRWKFIVLTPFDPKQYLVQRTTDPNADDWDKIPIHCLNQKLVR